MAPRFPHKTLLTAALAALMLLCPPAAGLNLDAASARPPAPRPTLAGAAAPLEIGLYAGAGCYGLAHITAFNRWLGSPARRLIENFNQTSWKALMSGVPWELNCYKPIINTMHFTFGVPMLPGDGSSTLARGAAGAYDSYFRSIAQQLVAGGYANVTLRVGWEFNGNWQPWASYKDPGAFIRYYQRIVNTMRTVPGAHFTFDWCPNITTAAYPPQNSYPGDGFVDYVGMDVYDAVWSSWDLDPVKRWNKFVTQPNGLQWQVNFAAAHHKMLSMPEWGCCGNSAGDNPYFITQMAAWLKNNHYAYAAYWDSNDAYKGMLSNNQYPQAAAAFVTWFHY